MPLCIKAERILVEMEFGEFKLINSPTIAWMVHVRMYTVVGNYPLILLFFVFSLSETVAQPELGHCVPEAQGVGTYQHSHQDPSACSPVWQAQPIT